MFDLAPLFCLSVLSTLFMKSSRSISIPLTVATTFCSVLEKPSLFLKRSAKTKENNAIAITSIKNNDLCLILFNIAIVA